LRIIEAIYEKGKITLLEDPKVKKAKVLVTFLSEFDKIKTKNKFPTKSLGNMKEFDRSEIYGEYLSSRF
jgi:hypothetical protein